MGRLRGPWKGATCISRCGGGGAGGGMRLGQGRFEGTCVLGNSVVCAALAAGSKTAPSQRGPSARPLPQAGWKLVFSDAAAELRLGLSDSKICRSGSAQPLVFWQKLLMPMPFTPALCPHDHPYPGRGMWGAGTLSVEGR